MISLDKVFLVIISLYTASYNTDNLSFETVKYPV